MNRRTVRNSKRKGSAGWVLLGLIAILVLFGMVRVFYHGAIEYKLRHQNIIFGEVEILRVKNTLLLAEKSIAETFAFSARNQIFDSAQNGFGSEFWYRIDESGSQTGSIPSKEGIKASLDSGFMNYRTPAYDKDIDVNGVWLRIYELVPSFTIEDNKIGARISGKMKTFAGNPRTTESPKTFDYSYTYDVQLQKLFGAGKLFSELPSKLSLGEFSDAGRYKDHAIDSIKSEFNSIGIEEKSLEIEKAEFVVSQDLLFHYLLKGHFPDSAWEYLGSALETKPLSLAVKVEDYKTALKCDQDKILTFSSDSDMACVSGVLYTCNMRSTEITGIGNNRLQCTNSQGQRIGNYACGESGFKEQSAIDSESCYCTAFGGSWLERNWVCEEESEEPLDGWLCTQLGEKYKCTKEDSCGRCSIGTKSCDIPAGCRGI
jgi:hypothetical protein